MSGSTNTHRFPLLQVLSSRVLPQLFTVGIFLVLGVAGVSKLIHPEPAVRFLSVQAHLTSRGWVYAVAAFEITLALWLLSGVKRSQAALFTVGLFTIFLVIHAMTLSVEGDSVTGCGCFGAVGAEAPAALWLALAVVGLIGASTIALCSGSGSRPVEVEQIEGEDS
ncbi:MAG: hypothetical protein EA376_12375 [Phycisphaeraceae bacterium]|nr:MAG: hypothetical protein EA376_12375 [Phycisphaeraceae bacterium]